MTPHGYDAITRQLIKLAAPKWPNKAQSRRAVRGAGLSWKAVAKRLKKLRPWRHG